MTAKMMWNASDIPHLRTGKKVVQDASRSKLSYLTIEQAAIDQ
jgi:hypothetical protein